MDITEEKFQISHNLHYYIHRLDLCRKEAMNVQMPPYWNFCIHTCSVIILHLSAYTAILYITSYTVFIFLNDTSALQW